MKPLKRSRFSIENNLFKAFKLGAFSHDHGKYMELEKKFPSLPIEEGRINLKDFSKYYLAANIINVKFLAFNPMDEKYLNAYKRSKTYSEIEKHFQREHMKILELKTEEIPIQNYCNTLNMPKETTSREIYNFLNNYPTNVPISQEN